MAPTPEDDRRQMNRVYLGVTALFALPLIAFFIFVSVQANEQKQKKAEDDAYCASLAQDDPQQIWCSDRQLYGH